MSQTRWRSCVSCGGAPLAVLLAMLLLATAPHADPLAEVPPRPLAGPYPVACTNVEQDFARLPAGEPPELTWEGYPRTDGSQRYATDLLSDPANTLIARFRAPDDGTLFGPWRGAELTYVVIVCYPTAADNARADYVLPNGKRIPRMQRGDQAPILADGTARWPVALFSHGYGGSPLSNDYLEAVAVFASHGYVTVAPFHGDPRYALLSLGDLGAVVQSIANFERYTAMQSTRPLSLSAALDLLLAHPQWRDHVDPERVGGFGASQGGESLMLMGGARLTTSIFGASRPVGFDPRLKGAAGYVPYFGHRILPAFGRDNEGTQGLTLPFLAISGTADTTAPIGPVEQGMARLAGSRAHVALTGVTHGFDEASAGDIFTWSLAWLDAFARDDRGARARLDRMTRVSGGGDDVVRMDYIAPAAPLGGEAIVVEYHHDGLDHYFVTADPREIAILDAGTEIRGWRRTGYAFKAWDSAGLGDPACRFYGTPGLGVNSHFYSIFAHECALLLTRPEWTFEGFVFRSEPTGPLVCPADRVVVQRLYNNGRGGQPNHRYLTSTSVIGDMVGAGWVLEGPVFCMPP